jgi:hypothetical protein
VSGGYFVPEWYNNTLSFVEWTSFHSKPHR